MFDNEISSCQVAILVGKPVLLLRASKEFSTYLNLKAVDLLEILAKWALWLFDAIGVNLVLKKIARVFDKKDDNTKSDTNQLASPQRSQTWTI